MLETSIATSPQPASRIRASRSWSTGASGVVKAAGSLCPATREPVVPMTPTLNPTDCPMASIIQLVVVLPLVPVIPTTGMLAPGKPATAAEASARA
jgi:hypothetical protein